jgi:hypothetical protein
MRQKKFEKDISKMRLKTGFVARFKTHFLFYGNLARIGSGVFYRSHFSQRELI